MQRYAPLDSLDEVVRRHDLRLLVLFGSDGTEREKADSDIDPAWLGNRMLTFPEQEALLHDLIFHFRKAEMELVDLAGADPILRAAIAQEGRVVYESEPGLFDRLAFYDTNQRMDLAPMIEERIRQTGQHIREDLRHTGKGGHLHQA